MKKAKEKSYYKWVIVLGLFLIMAFPVAIISAMHSLFMNPVSQSLGLKSTMFAVNFTIIAIAIGITSPIMGKYLNRWNVKYVMAICGVISGLSFASFGLTKNIYMFYIISIILGITFTGVNQLTVSYVISQWFKEDKGKATGMIFAGTSLSSFIFMPIVAGLIEKYGYDKLYISLGIIVAVISLLVSLLIIEETPRSNNEKDKQGTSNPKENSALGYTKKEAMRNPTFWLFGVAILGLGIIASGIQTHIPASMQSVGFTATKAASIVSVKSLFGLMGSVFMGLILDKYNLKISTSIIGAVVTGSIILLLFSENILIAYLFAILHGLFMAISGIGPSYYTSEIYGNKEYGPILGVIFSLFLVGGSIGPVVSSIIFDSTGSYKLVWIIYSIISALVFMAIIYAVRKSERKRGKNTN